MRRGCEIIIIRNWIQRSAVTKVVVKRSGEGERTDDTSNSASYRNATWNRASKFRHAHKWYFSKQLNSWIKCQLQLHRCTYPPLDAPGFREKEETVQAGNIWNRINTVIYKRQCKIRALVVIVVGRVMVREPSIADRVRYE